MMTILFYVGKLIVASGLLYGYYYLFLRNKTFHRYNRFYLVLASLLSIVLPFFKIPVSLFSGAAEKTVLLKTLRVISVSEWEKPVIIYANRGIWHNLLTIQNALLFLYLAGAITGFVLLLQSLIYIIRIKKKYAFEKIDGIKLYNTNEKGTPFSFFRLIFWNSQLNFNTKEGQQIFRHELFHVKENHSSDILLMELLTCIAWLNPFYHLMKKEIKAIHEFLADEYAIYSNNRYDYAELLVLHTINQKTPDITHPFFHNQIKRRITMITKSNLIRRNSYLSRMMALPLLFVLVSAFAIKLTNKQVNNNHSSSGKTLTVIIDAGHGGIDNGTINENGIVEKNLNLAIAQKIKELSAGFNVNVELTRNSDVLPGNAFSIDEGLAKRIELTKEKKADLFVSIHVNTSVTASIVAESSGFEVFVTSKKENEKSKLLGLSILNELKNIYSTSETIKQREVGIRVLDENICPAIILECGYINNPKDLSFIADKNNQEKIARNILEGIVKYSNASPGNYGIAKNDTIINIRLAEGKKVAIDTIVDVKLFSTDAAAGEKTIRPGPNNVWIADTASSAYFDDNGSDKNKKKLIEEYLKGKLNEFDKEVNNQEPSGKEKIYKKVEIEPDFPGGRNGWITYLQSHLKYPQKAQDKEIQGTVLIQFIIDKNGNTSDVKAISGPKELKVESVRVIKESGKWIPAIEKGQKVAAYKRQPITYRLERQG